ncbi:MAG: hypothetical protein WC428_02535 [Candidatus Paceibacterota bacterium]|jgi:hypothetical protein
MKKILSLNELQTAINNRWEFKQDVNGKTYELSVVFVLNMKLIELITMIKEGRLFYTEIIKK